MEYAREPWLPDWTAIIIPQRPGEPNIHTRYREECDRIILAGNILALWGGLPPLEGTAAPATHRQGTGGNFAFRCPHLPEKCIVTARGADKRRLLACDFVEVVRVDWEEKEIWIRRHNDTALPSTDALVMSAAFEADPKIKELVHIHEALEPPSLWLPYPALWRADAKRFGAAAASSIRMVHLIDHDLFVKEKPDGKPDSTTIIGEEYGSALDFVIRCAVRKSNGEKHSALEPLLARFAALLK